jgi:hypothetical protein
MHGHEEIFDVQSRSRHFSFLHCRRLQILQYFSKDVWIGSKVGTETIKACLLFGLPDSSFLVANKM